MSESRRVWKHNHLEEPYEECPTLQEYVDELCKICLKLMIANDQEKIETVRNLLREMRDILLEMSEGEWRVINSEFESKDE